MYLPSDHSVLVEFANTIKQKFDINVRDFEFLVILACENNRQDILDYILVSKSIPFSKERLTSLKNLEKNTKKNIKNQNIETCFICIEPFNKTTHSLVKCKCDYKCCRTCVKYYILNNPQDPHCMNCKVSWDRKMLTDNFEAKFINSELKEYRENVLFERELGMMPQTQIHVDNQIQVENLLKENVKIQSEIDILQIKIQDNHTKMYNIKNNVKTERRAFVRKCPNRECRGFLSNNLKCNICEKWACGDCREVKGDTRDAEHTCNPDTIESIKILEKETRECPKCSYKISKISGCNQMYCTPEYGGCGTAFDWKTLKIETRIHNPHYYEFMRKQGTLQREAGDIVCGRELDGHFYNELSKKLNPKKNKNIFDMIRMIRHTTEVDLRKFTPRTRLQGNLDLRILYMRNKIDADTMKKDIQKREKENGKKQEIFNVIQMFSQCMTDIFYRLYDNPKLIKIILSEIETLRLYSNECLNSISKSYKCTEYSYNTECELVSLKKIKEVKVTTTTKN
jgi:hypothetical protein